MRSKRTTYARRADIPPATFCQFIGVRGSAAVVASLQNYLCKTCKMSSGQNLYGKVSTSWVNEIFTRLCRRSPCPAADSNGHLPSSSAARRARTAVSASAPDFPSAGAGLLPAHGATTYDVQQHYCRCEFDEVAFSNEALHFNGTVFVRQVSRRIFRYSRKIAVKESTVIVRLGVAKSAFEYIQTAV